MLINVHLTFCVQEKDIISMLENYNYNYKDRIVIIYEIWLRNDEKIFLNDMLNFWCYHFSLQLKFSVTISLINFTRRLCDYAMII